MSEWASVCVCWRKPARCWVCVCGCSGQQFNGLGLFGNRLKQSAGQTLQLGNGKESSSRGGPQKLGTQSRNIPNQKSETDWKNNEQKNGGGGGEYTLQHKEQTVKINATQGMVSGFRRTLARSQGRGQEGSGWGRAARGTTLITQIVRFRKAFSLFFQAPHWLMSVGVLKGGTVEMPGTR